MELFTLHLFAGCGGGILADMRLGHTPIGAVEIEKYPRRILLQRQLDGILPVFPIWDDIRTFRADNPICGDFFNRCRAIRNKLAICGGFPCQDISTAGKGEGIDGAKSGLWREMSRVIGEIRPKLVLVENSAALLVRGIDRVLGEMAAMGYDTKWGVISGADAIWSYGNPAIDHERKRIWIAGKYEKDNIGSDSDV